MKSTIVRRVVAAMLSAVLSFGAAAVVVDQQQVDEVEQAGATWSRAPRSTQGATWS